jgi:ATP-dependent DNA ligase
MATFPLDPPIAPMLAKLTPEIPAGEGWWYEPKWDGFRCIVFRSGADIELASRNERPFNRYFPELLEPLLSALPDQAVIDGEIVLPSTAGAGLDFDALQQRIHPAASRVKRLAAETPSMFVAFDALYLDGRNLMNTPFAERRRVLETGIEFGDSVKLTPISTDPAVGQQWFTQFEGAGLDGVIAKRSEMLYLPDKRVMAKIKHTRTADCVVAGYRVHKDGNGVGSLLLGLYDDAGALHSVGVTAAFSAAFRRELVDLLAPLRDAALDNHPWAGWVGGGEHSRWNVNKDLSFEPLRIERVVEVTFGQLQSGRFRHGVQFVRWRDDRDPRSCTFEQLDVAQVLPVARLFGGAVAAGPAAEPGAG